MLVVTLIKAERSLLEQDPDQRVREPIALALGKVRELVGTVRQALLWLRQERIAVPANRFRSSGWQEVWKKILT